MPISFGRVSYVNSLPLFCAKPSFDIVSAIPSRLNEMARRGALDASLVSRWIYPQVEKDYAVIPQYCIGGDGEIMSVSLYSRVPPERLGGRRIFITSETGTSSRAFRYLLKKRCGIDIFSLERAPIESADALLLIGNRALGFDGSDYGYFFDLGSLWREIVGLKMIYAATIVRREILSSSAPLIERYFDESLSAFSLGKAEVVERARKIFAESEGREISSRVLSEYYNRLIYKMDADDFKKSFDYVSNLALDGYLD